MPPTFETFFRRATATTQSPQGNTPYDYQRRLAGDMAGRTCESQLIAIPTGLGKTAAVVLAWLWNRVAHPDTAHRETWPRRLIYCLPMRTLVEQTRDETRNWIANLVKAGLVPADHTPRVIVLMGGENLDGDEKDWDIHPEADAILIGTQDMLLSRALNRGYGMSRYRWPLHFGLLNNDCLWVMDETQLMGVSVETSAQLAGFRSRWRGLGACPTWWMSATLDDARLATVDHRPPGQREHLTVEEMARPDSRPAQLFAAKKSVAPALVSAERLTLSPGSKDDYAKHLAKLVVDKHRRGTLTLVIVNRVSRAQKLFQELTSERKEGGKKSPPLYDPARVALIHSRFRRPDRERHEHLLFGDGDRIVVATQAVEAGVDVSARLLVTELAPWSSLVQRFGRCNRRAEFPDAEILWIDIEPDAKGDLLRPYSARELDPAREVLLRPLVDASPKTLSAVQVEPEKIIRPVIRHRDLVDLFDTTPDLCGQDLDISRYIRDEQDNDVQLFWRDTDSDGPAPDTKPPHRDELCRVAIGAANDFIKTKTTRAWRWNPLDEKWETAKAARPGAVYLIAAADGGGYSDDLGWTGNVADKPTPRPPAHGECDRYRRDRRTFDHEWQTLTAHTADVVAEMQRIIASLALKDAAPEAAALLTAARWHDVGKAHPHFQAALQDGPHKPDNPGELYAKSKNPPKPRHEATPYRSLRHELASALAWLLRSASTAPERDLVAYLIAAHHGKVRLSIRSLPDEKGPPASTPENPECLFARGIWHGDRLPALTLDDLTIPETTLDLRFMRMGESELGPSWLARTIALRDSHGPFRLALLESLLRAADARASALAEPKRSAHGAPHELAANREPLAPPLPAGEAKPSLGQHSPAGGAEHGLRERAGGREEPSRETRPDHATRYLETSQGLLSYSALAPLLAERVQAVEADLSLGAFDGFPLGDELVLELHRRIIGDLIPDWAGRYRTTGVTVGRLSPPEPYLVSELMRNYGLDLQARWPEASAALTERTVEFLAFAEGRFLTIHPFQDFNGRTIRVFLGELLRRLDLPPVTLEAEGEAARAAYFAALEAADAGDFRPLMTIWQQRLSTGA